MQPMSHVLLILAFVSESLQYETWTITISRNITAKRGSDVVIPCTFDCPNCDGKVSVIWKKRIGDNFDGSAKSKNEFVYHEQKNKVLERYRSKTELLKKGTKDCSLRIQNVAVNDQDIYVRLEKGKSAYSFFEETVSIFVPEIQISDRRTPSLEAGTTKKIHISDVTTPSPEAETTTMATTPKNSSATMYTAIFVPVAALVIIVILAGTLCFVKQKRKQSFTREDSGYYANFSRASSNNAKSEVSRKKVDNLPEINDIEEPVYVNAKHSLDQMEHNIDNTNNIYANVNYSR